MWPSQRRGSIGLDSQQRKSRARSRDRREIRPIVTLSEARTLLSQPGTWAAVAPLPTARVYLGAATGNDGTIYAIGGLVYGRMAIPVRLMLTIQPLMYGLRSLHFHGPEKHQPSLTMVSSTPLAVVHGNRFCCCL